MAGLTGLQQIWSIVSNHLVVFFSITTRSVSIGHSDWLKQVGWLNARATEENSPAIFFEYWIAVQARIEKYIVINT